MIKCRKQSRFQFVEVKQCILTVAWLSDNSSTALWSLGEGGNWCMRRWLPIVSTGRYSTKMRTAVKCIKCHDFASLQINLAFIYLVIMDWMVYISAFSIKARTDESESYLKCLLFMLMTCPISHSSKYYAFWQSTWSFKVLFLTDVALWYEMTHILGRFKPFILHLLQLAFIHIAMSRLSLHFIERFLQNHLSFM